jgi:hypothetical protein
MEKALTIYDVQPIECRMPLPDREVAATGYMKRVMFFDPTPIYERVKDSINPFNRYNWENVNFTNLFPETADRKCACGCGGDIPKGRSRWATNECQFFAIGVWNVLGGRQDFIRELFKAYYGNQLCMSCGEKKWNDLDHVFPVSKGGGGCWLSNFQGLCKKCHKEKTRQDFSWVKLKNSE